MTHNISRRKFLGTTAAAGATLALPYYIPSRAFGANDRVVIASIGVGNQGTANLKAFLQRADVAAVCDVDSKRLATAAELVESTTGRTCDAVSDYRKLLDRKDIDAVIVTTPDHWHALPTIAACEAGKDVYCEKPLTLTISEGRKMVAAARQHQRVVQTGSQQRSGKEFWQACSLVRAGALGDLKSILVGIPAVNFSPPPVADSAPPPELDYNFWLGPAPEKPYNAKHVHYLFRFFWDYSGGQMTNFGAHHLDIAQWALNMDASGPVATEGTGTFHPEKWYEVPMSCRVTHTYASGVTVTVGQLQDDIPGGLTFVGSRGTLTVGRGKISTDPPELLEHPLPTGAEALPQSRNHHDNFLECIKSREKPICDVEIGHRSATVCHLGNIAIRTGRRLEWDPVKEQIVGDEDANAMLSRPYRSPWKLS